MWAKQQQNFKMEKVLALLLLLFAQTIHISAGKMLCVNSVCEFCFRLYSNSCVSK